MVKNKQKREILLVIGILVIAALGFVLTRNVKVAKQVVVELDGELYGEYNLNEDQTIYIESSYGNNTLIIHQNEIYMKNANCPDQYCIKQGHITHTGESIICLPHKLVVELKGVDSNQDVDIIAK